HHRLRCIRRDHAGHRWTAARVGNREPSRQGRAGRAEGRGTAPGQSDQHRSDWENSTQPQGAAAGRSGGEPTPITHIQDTNLSVPDVCYVLLPPTHAASLAVVASFPTKTRNHEENRL